MNRRAKLIEHLLALPVEMAFDDVTRLLEQHGFELRRTSGSHNIFSDGQTALTVPTVNGRTVKRAYLVQIVAVLGLKGESE